MLLSDPRFLDPRYMQLVADFIRTRDERTTLILTGRDTDTRLEQLAAEEMMAQGAMVDYKLEHRISGIRSGL